MTTSKVDDQLARMYRDRFSRDDLAFKAAMWRVLCEDFFQRYVGTTDRVVDLGAGTCEFINAIHCGQKLAVDLNPDVAGFARDAGVVLATGSALPVATGSVDVVFCSNFFEHLPDKPTVLATLEECHRVLCHGGRLIILQPNIRYLPGRYWDYFDHHTPLSHLSMLEALRLSGFVEREVIPRFLPYTVKDARVPRSALLVRAYLRCRPIWPILGRQMLIVASPAPLSTQAT